MANGASHNLTGQVSQLAEKARTRAENVLKAAILELFARIVERTPVDTGRARGNWQIDLDAKSGASLLATDKSGRETIARAMAKLDKLDKNSRVVLITNNLAYIKALEYGHSRQAPSGMIRISVAEFKGILARMAKKVAP